MSSGVVSSVACHGKVNSLNPAVRALSPSCRNGYLALVKLGGKGGQERCLDTKPYPLSACLCVMTGLPLPSPVFRLEDGFDVCGGQAFVKVAGHHFLKQRLLLLFLQVFDKRSCPVILYNE